MVTTIVAAVFVLGFLVLFHELGHFLVAKRAGSACSSSRLASAQRSSQTDRPHRIRDQRHPARRLRQNGGRGPPTRRSVPRTGHLVPDAIPLDPYGDRPRGPVRQPPVRRHCLQHRVRRLRGARPERGRQGRRRHGEPAGGGTAGLQMGDVITAVDGTPVDKWDRLSEIIRASNGKALRLAVTRDGNPLEIAVTPEARPDKNIFGETVGTAYVIGIERRLRQAGRRRRQGQCAMGVEQTGWWVETLLVSLVKMVHGRIPRDQIGGPILIAQAAGQQARLGLEYLLHFMAVISVNLGSSICCPFDPRRRAPPVLLRPRPSCAARSTPVTGRSRSRWGSCCSSG